MVMRGVNIVFLFFLLPTWAHAAVIFSEVAWMGAAESANYEWIELHNDGAAVDVTGWEVRDGMNLNIELAGVIPAGSYAVLERTSDDSAPGTAFLVYTGALVNTGATLSLVRNDGSIEDQVSGGEDWQNIGGDNVSKETAQYTSGGWVTAAATPGRGITAAEVEAAAAVPEEKKTTTHYTSGGPLIKAEASEPVVLTLPDVTLQLAVKAQSVGYVHQPIKLSAEASGIGDTLIDSLQYEWNFGDGTVAAGKEVVHVYDYPGTYVVTVYGGYKRQEQVARFEVTILPIMLSLTTNAGEDVQVNNDSPYEIDISGYVVEGAREFTFPPRTILLPGQTITLSHKKLGSSERMVAVYDTERAVVASFVPGSVTALGKSDSSDESLQPPVRATIYSRPGELTAEPFDDLTLSQEFAEEPEPTKGTEKIIDNLTEQMAAVGAAPLPNNERWPYAALAVILLLATLGVYAAPRRPISS